MAEARETQMAFIKSHNLREIAENRVGVAFTESADQGVKAWMVDMIASGDKEGYESEAHATLMGFDVRTRLKEIHTAGQGARRAGPPPPAPPRVPPRPGSTPPPSRQPVPGPAVLAFPATGPDHGRQRSPPAHLPGRPQAAAPDPRGAAARTTAASTGHRPAVLEGR